jgi:hypothetical protein
VPGTNGMLDHIISIEADLVSRPHASISSQLDVASSQEIRISEPCTAENGSMHAQPDMDVELTTKPSSTATFSRHPSSSIQVSTQEPSVESPPKDSARPGYRRNTVGGYENGAKGKEEHSSSHRGDASFPHLPSSKPGFSSSETAPIRRMSTLKRMVSFKQVDNMLRWLGPAAGDDHENQPSDETQDDAAPNENVLSFPLVCVTQDRP